MEEADAARGQIVADERQREIEALAAKQAMEEKKFNESVKQFGLSEAGKDRRAEIGADATRSQGLGTKPTGSSTEKYVSGNALRKQIGDLRGIYSKLTPEQREMLSQPVEDVLAGTVLPDGVKRIYDREKLYPDPVVRDFLERRDKITSSFSKMDLGKQITGFEIKDRDKWSPSATGLDLDDMMRRLDTLDNVTDLSQKAFEVQHPGYVVKSSSSTDRSGMAVGTVVDGYRYKGGDPNDQNNWEEE
jgi:hypothetical protein